MNQLQDQHYNFLYEQHLINLRLQGKRPSTIDAYARAVRRITAFFDKTPDTLTMADLKQYFNSFHVKLPSKENPYGLVHLVSIMIAKRFLVVIDIAHNVSKVQRQRGLKDKSKNVYLLSIS